MTPSKLSLAPRKLSQANKKSFLLPPVHSFQGQQKIQIVAPSPLVLPDLHLLAMIYLLNQTMIYSSVSDTWQSSL